MSMSYFVAMKSKDPSTKIGAVIVGPYNEVRSTGYNGLPRGVNDNISKRNARPTKYFYYTHAEANAVFNAARMGISTNGCTMYTPGMPCADCCRAIIQSGVKKVVIDWRWDLIARNDTESNKKWLESGSHSKHMFSEAGVKVIKYSGPLLTEITALRGDKILNLKTTKSMTNAHPKCKKCNEKATYSTPRNLCTQHWAEWWTKGYPKKLKKQAIAEIMVLPTS